MDSEFIADLCASLLLEEKGSLIVVLSDKHQPFKEARLGRCPVGKILCSKSVNRKAFQLIILYAWNANKTMVVESLGENMNVFYFSFDFDKRRVILNGP